MAERPGDAQVSDEQLVTIALDGSDAAFRTLVERYQERLLRFLLTRSACRADAEDALQDTFISAYRHLHSFDARWRFSTWIYRIGIRKLGKKRAMTSATVDPDRLADPAADPLAACIARSDRRNLWLTAKAVLNEEAFTALWLRYAEDMTVSDVAATLERSLSWAKVTLSRARRRVAEALQDDAQGTTKGELYG